MSWTVQPALTTGGRPVSAAGGVDDAAGAGGASDAGGAGVPPQAASKVVNAIAENRAL